MARKVMCTGSWCSVRCVIVRVCVLLSLSVCPLSSVVSPTASFPLFELSLSSSGIVLLLFVYVFF